jgi:hypothetical protein
MGLSLPSPVHVGALAQMVSADDIERAIACGPDLEPIVERAPEAPAAGTCHGIAMGMRAASVACGMPRGP